MANANSDNDSGISDRPRNSFSEGMRSLGSGIFEGIRSISSGTAQKIEGLWHRGTTTVGSITSMTRGLLLREGEASDIELIHNDIFDAVHNNAIPVCLSKEDREKKEDELTQKCTQKTSLLRTRRSTASRIAIATGELVELQQRKGDTIIAPSTTDIKPLPSELIDKKADKLRLEEEEDTTRVLIKDLDSSARWEKLKQLDAQRTEIFRAELQASPALEGQRSPPNFSALKAEIDLQIRYYTTLNTIDQLEREKRELPGKIAEKRASIEDLEANMDAKDKALRELCGGIEDQHVNEGTEEGEIGKLRKALTARNLSRPEWNEGLQDLALILTCKDDAIRQQLPGAEALYVYRASLSSFDTGDLQNGWGGTADVLFHMIDTVLRSDGTYDKRMEGNYEAYIQAVQERTIQVAGEIVTTAKKLAEEVYKRQQERNIALERLMEEGIGKIPGFQEDAGLVRKWMEKLSGKGPDASDSALLAGSLTHGWHTWSQSRAAKKAAKAASSASGSTIDALKAYREKRKHK